MLTRREYLKTLDSQPFCTSCSGFAVRRLSSRVWLSARITMCFRRSTCTNAKRSEVSGQRLAVCQSYGGVGVLIWPLSAGLCWPAGRCSSPGSGCWCRPSDSSCDLWAASSPHSVDPAPPETSARAQSASSTPGPSAAAAETTPPGHQNPNTEI